jgi:hypothetical protein
MHRYRIYGLLLQSNRALSGLIEAEPHGQPPDLSVDWRGDVPGAPEGQCTWSKVRTPELGRRKRVLLRQARQPDGISLWLQYATRLGRLDFVIGPGARQLDIYWPATVSFGDMQSYFVGPVLACVLRRRGVLCLHASVVVHGDWAVAIIGDKGAGKSTSAAVLVRHGWRSLADDIAALAFDDDAITVHPGYPRMRLSPIATRNLFDTTTALVPVYSHVDKRYLDLSADPISGNFVQRSMPLAGVFLLGPRVTTGEPLCEPVNAGEGLIALAKNTIGNYVVFDDASRRREFALLGRLASSVPLYRLRCPDGLAALSSLSGFLRNSLGPVPDA